MPLFCLCNGGSRVTFKKIQILGSANTKNTLLTKKAEKKMKEMDEKIKILKDQLYTNVSSLHALKNKNMKISKIVKKVEVVHEDQFVYPDILRSVQDKLNQNPHFMKIIDALKNEVYSKFDVEKLDDYDLQIFDYMIWFLAKTLLQCVIFPEKMIYSQWILQTLTEKMCEKSGKNRYDCSLDTLIYLRKILSYCNIPVADVFPAMLNILDVTSFNILSDNEQDLLIFMHVIARMQNIFDFIKTFDIKQSRKQFLSTKTERYELQKRQMQLLNQIKHFIDGLEKINLYGVFNAITKSNDVHVKAEEITKAYENFKKYIIHVSGQTNSTVDILQDENSVSYGCKLQKINNKIQQCILQGIKKSSENFEPILRYDLFQEDVKNLIQYIREFIGRITNMSINGIEETRRVLNCLKVQADFTLKRKWSLQKEILPFICGNDKGLLLIGRCELLLEHLQDTMFSLKILEKIEFNKNFSLMSDLCHLREKKDLLIEKFRYFIMRIGCQKAKHIPIIKKELLDFNKEIQILLSDYHKFRYKLQYFDIQEEKNLENMLEDIRSVIMTSTKSEEKNVGFTIKKKIEVAELEEFVFDPKVNIVESEADEKKIRDNLEEIGKTVDETMEFLHLLDETIISEKFSAMKYLCELHCLKTQIISAFENLFYSIFKLDIHDDEAIIERLNKLNSAGNSLIKRYETIGAQLIVFSDVMAIVHKEKSEISTYPNQDESDEIPEINISNLFGKTDSLKKLHFKLDNAVKYKWFPAKRNLPEMLKDKEKIITTFVNFLERLPELDVENTMEAIHSLKQLMLKAENVLRRFQSLRLQLIWIANEYIFSIET